MKRKKSRTDVYPLHVDYGRSVKDGVRAGRYDWVDPRINSRNFKTKRKGTAKVVVELLKFKCVSAYHVLDELGRMGYRPADLHELLAFGEKYPDVQREFPVVALGSIWQPPDDERKVPILYGNGSERSLNLGWIHFDCEIRDYRFAAVRK